MYYAKETGMTGFLEQQTSVTLETSWNEVTKYVALSPASELALQSGNSKLCTGLKVDNLRNGWAYTVVLGLILK